jgi:pyruvate dehydrogenase E1 component beta subunit
VLCADPVVYIDDRWLYDLADDLPDVVELDLRSQGPRRLADGSDLTIVAAGYSTRLALDARAELATAGVSVDVIDLRVLNPFDPAVIVDSVRRTRRMLVVDGGWKNAGFAAEVIASVVEQLDGHTLERPPQRMTLPSAPAPTSRELERRYYPSSADVARSARNLLT